MTHRMKTRSKVRERRVSPPPNLWPSRSRRPRRAAASEQAATTTQVTSTGQADSTAQITSTGQTASTAQVTSTGQDAATGRAVSTGRAAPRVNLMNVLTNRNGKEPSIQVLKLFCHYINGSDRENICKAFEGTTMDMRDGLQHKAAPLPQSMCEDYPPLNAATWRRSRLYSPRPTPRVPRQPCDIPAHQIVRQRKCQGPSLGYKHHKDNFWVCDHCVRRAWETYSLEHRPVCYDLCRSCSLEYRKNNPIAALGHCLCLWERPDSQIPLCAQCRQTHAAASEQADLNLLRASQMRRPMFTADRRHEQARGLKEFIQPTLFGESKCTCGVLAMDRINSYPLVPPRFGRLVRICSHCQKENFRVYYEPNHF